MHLSVPTLAIYVGRSTVNPADNFFIVMISEITVAQIIDLLADNFNLCFCVDHLLLSMGRMPEKNARNRVIVGFA